MFEQIRKIEELIKLEPQNITNYFNLGNIYIKLKNYNLALKNFQITIDIDKNFIQGYNNLGNINKELKNTKEAINFFKQAIKIDPNYINAAYNLANIYSEIGEYEKAGECYKKILKINPSYIPALNNFGILLKNINMHNDALKCFEKIIDIDPNFLRAYNNIGTILLETGEVNKAIDNYKKALELDSNNFISYKNLLAAFENSNQINNYEEMLKLSKKKFPKEKILDFYHSIFLFRKKKYKESIKILSKNDFGDEFKIKQNFFLARAYDFINEHDLAFKHFHKANNLTNKTQEAKEFDKNKYLQTLEVKKNYFIKKNIIKWKSINYKPFDLNPTFLIGFPRSGTTLLDTILRSHPKIEVIEEKPMFLKTLNLIKNNDLNSFGNISEIEINNMREKYLNEINKNIKEFNKLNIYIDKLPLNITNVGEILRIFPNAKFILALRHPMDCVLSCYMQDFKLNEAMVNFLDIKSSAILYKKTMELWEQYKSIFKINYVQIKYEDLIENFEKNIKIIIKFLDLNWDKSLLDYRKTAAKRESISTPSYYQVVQPIYKHANQRWRKYKKYLVNIDPILEDFVKKYDY